MGLGLRLGPAAGAGARLPACRAAGCWPATSLSRAWRLALAGHHITVSYSRDRAALSALAETIGGTAGEPSEAAAAEVVVLSVPWG
ncbi:MAG TPA: NAD(P)-binding domain-containing protein [Streptosporangiaceae bacterium]|nr:NAD(P)-binding domain-containing protein [Streptosporangiaceae bacterium]